MRVSVTYDLVTEASAADGDHADHGYIHPLTEARRSCARGGWRVTERNFRMSRAGRFDWSLREAIAFIAGRSCSAHETCFSGTEDRIIIRCTDEYKGADEGKETIRGSRVVSVSYDLIIESPRWGTLMRLARLAAYHGVYLANMPLVMRAQRADARAGLVPDISGRRQAFGERVTA